jgi:bifunctional enzyme CysN/CysC/sulfate adenylyltransferase subunit 1
VIRPHLDYRGFAGQIASGVVRRGETVVVLPSGRKSKVKSIDTFAGAEEQAFAPQSVTLRLEDEVDVSRGDMIVREGELPRVTRRFDAMLVWMSERPYSDDRALLLKQTTRMVPARIERIGHRLDLETLENVSASGLSLNDIARVSVRCNRPIFCDAYAENRVTGAFILIDALSNDTVAAGMIEAVSEASESTVVQARGDVSDEERRDRLGQRGSVLFVGSEAGLARRIERGLFDRGVIALVVPAADMSREAALEVAVRAASAGLAVILVGAGAAIEAGVITALGETRALRAAEIGRGEGDLVSALASACLTTSN